MEFFLLLLLVVSESQTHRSKAQKARNASVSTAFRFTVK